MVYETRYETKDGKTSRVDDQPATNSETTLKTNADRDAKSTPAPNKGARDE